MTERALVTYAGRHGLESPGADAIDEWRIGDPAAQAALRTAGALAVLDPLSFPWEATAALLPECPIYLLAPADLGVDEIEAVLGPVLDGLTFFDRVLAAEPVGRAIAQRRSWAASQVMTGTWDPAAAAAAIAEDFAARSSVSDRAMLERNEVAADEYWRTRGKAVGAQAPELAVCSIRHPLSVNRSMHLRQAAALLPALRRFMAGREVWNAVEVGCGVGRWVGPLGALGARVTGLDVSPDLLAIAAANHPEASFATWDGMAPMPCPDQSQDLALFVTVLHHIDPDRKVRTLGEVFRALRPSGLLVLLEDLSAPTLTPNPITFPMGWSDMQQLIARACGYSMVLEHFESVAYRHLPDVRTALVVLRKLGVAEA